MQLGMVTYLWGATWDLPTLLKNCRETGFRGVELRTTHAHGVEFSLSPEQRREVKQQFADSGVQFVGPGSACEFHSADHGVVARNIEETKQFLQLSADLGGSGVKVRPNGFVRGETRLVTIARIAEALRECGQTAADLGQEVRLEVHGEGTSDLKVVREIMVQTNHPAVRVCWNANPGEPIAGSIAAPLADVREYLGATIHIHELFDTSYPYREFFGLLNSSGYTGWLLSESPASTDTLRVMRYYKSLFDELVRSV